ncbi:MAG: hypothetical protein HY735_20500 [Verrucomicrobia bacterium]|nr:hypothetical protein [Verrucomicrobiota bacterium]
MHTIISTEQLRTLLNDTRQAMGEQPWIQATDDHAQAVNIPHGKMEALQRLDKNEWVFVPVVRTKKKNGKLIEHGFEVHRRETGWEVVTAALEIEGDQTAKVHAEAARNHAVQQELEKLRLRAGHARPVH